jgi:hypothetical protein
MSCCDYCCEGVIRFCQMCETHAGNVLHWEYVRLWHLEGLFPCDYTAPNHEWITKSRVWVDQMNAASHQSVEIRCSA